MRLCSNSSHRVQRLIKLLYDVVDNDDNDDGDADDYYLCPLLSSMFTQLLLFFTLGYQGSRGIWKQVVRNDRSGHYSFD